MEDTNFSPECVEAMIKAHLKPGMKISKDGVAAACEFLKIFVTEAIHRAHAESDNKDCVTATDIQRILPQLLLDF